MENNTTPFSAIYDSFFSRVTDDMYMEFNYQDTYDLLQSLLLNSISNFEFPRFDIFDYKLGGLVEISADELNQLNNSIQNSSGNGNFNLTTAKQWKGGYFNSKLTLEEINILSLYMVMEWLGQQLTTCENTRQKVTGSDFKMTSQANHMTKIKEVMAVYKAEGFHMQRLYGRRKRSEDGKIQSTIGNIMSTPQYGWRI